ncbi:hypothetical protein [Streptomyces sp. AC495_CC817]|uniref:hypothetical protein n=1 Tax=Streptomyces sp. AC495_CC817 TaxID=2823900 RepID=UPI0020B74995|nr:hypothetical protein [Streptomyces sp. AC495_CC817]
MDDALITERRPVTGPQVFGYVRHVTHGLARHTALVDCLADYCRRHELTLCGVFTDREATSAVRSPAFVGLLDALELPDTYGSVIPALSHLGPKRVAAERKRQIAATSTRLVVIRSITPTTGRKHPLDASRDLQQQGGT